jgi:hypothetical protein
LFEALECNISLQSYSWPYSINSGRRMTIEIMAENALFKLFNMDIAVQDSGSIFSSLPE